MMVSMTWKDWLSVVANVAQIISVGPLVILAATALKDRWDGRGGPHIFRLD
jgi:hypothetical protein